MVGDVSKYVFLVGLILAEAIRAPHRRRHKKEWKQRKFAVSRVTGGGVALDMIGFIGMEVIPLVYVLTPWLSFADYGLPPWISLLGIPTFAVALWLLWRSHADLGRNWSPTLQIMEGHSLVTEGVYRSIRHPIYAALWLWGIAQAALVQNWVAGLAGLASFIPIYVLRVPQEERMMIDHFGDEYRSYMERTGRVVPPLRRQ
ncbi:MAG: protein-S-isoprenylcysteine O-methyltransferase [Bacillota bacterium]